jgi:hypothetical protein
LAAENVDQIITEKASLNDSKTLEPNSEVKFDVLTERILGSLKESTARTYTPGAREFEYFSRQYKPQSGEYAFQGIHDFMRLLQEDRKLDPLEQIVPERIILRDFAAYLADPQRRPDVRALSDKTRADYVRVIQAIGKKCKIPIDLSEIQLPHGNITSGKHPWKIEEFANYLSGMELKYQCLNVCMFQSAMDGDLYSLKYGAIRKEFEAGIVPLAMFPENGYCYRGKTNVQYRTFIGKLGVKLLKEYLKGRELTDESPVFKIAQRSAEAYVARHAETCFGEWKGTNPYRLHGLRDFYRKRVVNVGHIPDPDYAEFMMAHDLGDIAKVYISMSPEEWREIFREYCDPALTFKIPCVEEKEKD